MRNRLYDEIADPEPAMSDRVRARHGGVQVVALLLGFAYLAAGATLVLQGGILAGELFRHASVIGLHGTALTGLLLLVYAGGLLTIGTFPSTERFALVFHEVVAVGLGVIFAIDADAFHRTLGVHQLHGALLLATGLILLTATIVAPVRISARGRSRSW